MPSWRSQPGPFLWSSWLGSDLWTHQLSQSTVGCCPAAPVTRPPAPWDSPLPLCREVGGTWRQMPGGYSHLHTSACLSPLPQAEPGAWPLTPHRDHWERRSCGCCSEGFSESLLSPLRLRVRGSSLASAMHSSLLCSFLPAWLLHISSHAYAWLMCSHAYVQLLLTQDPICVRHLILSVSLQGG